MNNMAEMLRSIAQNDYMIDTEYLPTGKDLLEAADYIEALVEELRDWIGVEYD